MTSPNGAGPLGGVKMASDCQTQKQALERLGGAEVITPQAVRMHLYFTISIEYNKRLIIFKSL